MFASLTPSRGVRVGFLVGAMAPWLLWISAYLGLTTPGQNDLLLFSYLPGGLICGFIGALLWDHPRKIIDFPLAVIALNMLFYGGVGGCVGLLWAQRRTSNDMNGPVCDRCGYSLVGNVSGVCPECGTKVTEERKG
jgi:hypothetical protein